jgi:metal-responsive CopG/Arc/MetJ family transcriptional regulator
MRYGNMVTIGSYLSQDLFERMEDLRWEGRITRSEFIRQSIAAYIALINQATKRRRKHNYRRKNN